MSDPVAVYLFGAAFAFVASFLFIRPGPELGRPAALAIMLIVSVLWSLTIAAVLVYCIYDIITTIAPNWRKP